LPRTSSISRLGLLVERRCSRAAPARQRPSAAAGTGQRSKRSRTPSSTSVMSATAQRNAPPPAIPSSRVPWAVIGDSFRSKTFLGFESSGRRQGGAVDVAPGSPARQRQPAAVLELGRRRQRPAVEAGALDPHGSKRGRDFENFALRLEAQGRVVAAAEGA